MHVYTLCNSSSRNKEIETSQLEMSIILIWLLLDEEGIEEFRDIRLANLDLEHKVMPGYMVLDHCRTL